jgi:hypothetical protein
MSMRESYKPYVEALVRWNKVSASHHVLLDHYLATVKELGVKHEQTMVLWHELLDSIDNCLAITQGLAAAESAMARSKS